MNSATVVIDSIEPKEGVSQKTGKPWKKFILHTNAGDFATFDAALANYANVGKTAAITYEPTQWGNDLKSLIVDETVPAAPPKVDPVRDRAADGGADWDLIGLRKTRCALWVAALGNHQIAHGGTPAAAQAAFIRELVLAAEIDIFHRQPAQETDDIPF